MTLSLFIAIVIVMGSLLIVTSVVRLHQLKIRIASTSLPDSPKAGRLGAVGRAARGPVVARGIWALDAQPTCFQQLSKSVGPPPYVLAHLPRDARRVGAGSTLQFGSCRIIVTRSSAIVVRADERISIPPPAKLFRSAHRLFVLGYGPAGGLQLRSYQLVSKP